MSDSTTKGAEGEPSSTIMEVDSAPLAETGDDTDDIFKPIATKTDKEAVSDKEDKTPDSGVNKITLEELVDGDKKTDTATDDGEEGGIVILDEDDGTENESVVFVTACESPVSKVLDETECELEGTQIIKKEKDDSTVSEKKDDAKDDEVLLINPLFGKTSVKSSSAVPVYDIDTSSSEEDEDGDGDGQDFSADVGLENLEEDAVAAANWANIGAQQFGQPCGINCFQEKGILVNEIERLRKAIFELGERQSVTEDFLEVEFGDKFEKYLKNREHLVKMGFGVKEPDAATDVIDGKRSSKSSELVELLKMIKEQSETNGANDDKSSTGSASQGKSASSGSGGSKNQNKSSPNSNTNRQQQNSHQNQRPKAIPNISKRNEYGRGGAMSYQQNYSNSMQPELLSRHPVLMQNQYQQQQLMGPPHSSSAAQQYYYDTMYANYTGSTVTRDIVSVVGRKDLYPQSSYGYGGGGGYSYRRGDGESSSYSMSSAAGSEEKQGSKRSRKRKRKLESSESRSGPGANAPTSAFSLAALIPQPSSGKQQDTTSKPEPGAANHADNINNDQSKRICPLCSKIISRKYLRDHLIVHQGFQLSCPICKEGFFMRRRLKLHLKDDHKMSNEETIPYLEKAIVSTESEIGVANLNGMMEKATIPTKKQVREQNNANDSDLPSSQPAKTGQKSATNRGGGGGASKGRPLIFGGQNQYQNQSRVRPEANDLYGPGGYAQYAARYLQQQRGSGAAPVSRLFTPF